MGSAAPGRDLKLAIVGATGAVGTQLVELLDARRFPYGDLKLFARADSSAHGVEAREREYPVEALDDVSALAGFDVVFLAVPPKHAVEILNARPGPIVIDLSGASRRDSIAPLVAPGLTAPDTIANLGASGVVAIADPSAYALAAILSAVGTDAASVVAATIILGASASGKERIAALVEQSAELLNARLDVEEGATQLAFNLFLHPNVKELSEQIASQAGALLGRAPAMMLQVAQAPTLHGTALSLFISGSGGAAAKEKLRAAPGLLLIEEGEQEFRGVVDTVGQEAIIVRLFEHQVGIALWCLYDNARLAALCALWVAENLLPRSSSTLT